ncbi:MAG: secretin N-terminal domain-containing protein [bacterium]
MKKLFVTLLTLFSLLTPAKAASAAATFSPGPEELAQQQGTHKPEKINLNLTSVSLKSVIQILANRLGKNILFDPDFVDRTVTLNLNQIEPLDAFKAILESNNLGYREMGERLYFITKANKISKQTIVRHIYCKYADAEELQKILSKVVISEFGTVMSDKRTNTLIIKESPEVLTRMLELIRAIDRPIQQVYIQAAIVEISSIDDHEFGVEWLWKKANYKSLKGRVGTRFDLRGDGGSESSGEVQLPAGQGLGVGIINSNIDVVLHALSENNDLKLLSRPKITTLDNQQSVIEVGDQIPFKVLNEFGVTSFEFKDATVRLAVKPHIIDSEYIMLDVAPKADFQNGATPDGTPIIATRKASTKVKIKNGQTLVIGGLMRNSLIVNQSKVPLLGSIPLLGMAFRSKKSTKVRTELIVFLTPIILEEGVSQDIFRQDFGIKHKLEKKFK